MMSVALAADSSGMSGPDRIVLIAPLLDDGGRFSQTVEDFSVEAFVTKLAVEQFTVAVLPWTAGFNVKGPGATRCEPVAHDLCRAPAPHAVVGESTNASSGGSTLLWCQTVPSSCTIRQNL